MKFCVIHPMILGTYFPVPEVELKEKLKLEVLKSDYYLAMCWCPAKYDISNGHNVKGAGLAPLSAHLPGVAADAVPEGSAAGMSI